MTAPLILGAGQGDRLGDDSFDVGYLTAECDERQVPLADAWAVRFETAAPVRRFGWFKGQRHFSGRWWSATMSGHVGYESWLERDQLMLLDFDPTVVGIASQPFWLSWRTPDGEHCSHAPDYFARRADGSAVVVDCRPLDRIRPKDAAKFDATRRACGLVGWEYRVVGAAAPILVGNVRWLAGYRHPRHDLPDVGQALQEVFSRSRPLIAGAEAAGDPVAVLPVLFHLLWRQELMVDLSVPLHDGSVVSATGGAP